MVLNVNTKDLPAARGVIELPSDTLMRVTITPSLGDDLVIEMETGHGSVRPSINIPIENPLPNTFPENTSILEALEDLRESLITLCQAHVESSPVVRYDGHL